MRILIDTNILLSGLYFHGLPKRLLQELNENFKICVNEKIIAEYTDKIDITPSTINPNMFFKNFMYV